MGDFEIRLLRTNRQAVAKLFCSAKASNIRETNEVIRLLGRSEEQ